MAIQGRDRREVAKAVGLALRARRQALGLSQEALGYRVGLDRTYVSGVERGRRNPTLLVLSQLAAGLGVPLSQLFAEAGL